jgi:hypothetical protein
MAVMLSALRAGSALLPETFLVLVYFRGGVNPRTTVGLEVLGKLKIFSDFIGNGTRNLQACNIVPQPIMLPRSADRLVH